MSNTPMTPEEITRLIDITERNVRAADWMRDRQQGKLKLPDKPLDAKDNVRDIGEAFLDHFREIYRHVRAGRSQYNREVDVRVTNGSGDSLIRKAFHFDDMTRSNQRVVENAFEDFARDLFHHNGQPRNDVNIQKLALHIGALHRTLEHSALYDTTTALGCFLYDLNFDGISEHFKKFAPAGIDACRAEPGAPVQVRYAQALDGSRKPAIPEVAGFIHPPGKEKETFVVLGGCRFPIHRIDSQEFPGGQWHLVLKNGQLVNATQKIQDDITNHLNAGGSINDITLEPTLGKDGKPLSVSQFIRPSSYTELSAGVKKQIEQALKDCTERSPEKDGVNPLAPCCIQEDLLTGLLMKPVAGKESQLDHFMHYVKAAYKDMDGMMTAYRQAEGSPEERFAVVAHNLRQARAGREAMGETKMQDKLFDATLVRIEKQFAKVLSLAEAECAKAEDAKGRKIAGWVLGPIAGGKGAAESAVTAQMGVHARAGLDDSRPHSDPVYWLEVLTNNHDADYPDSTNFGKLARTLTIRMAIEREIPLFVDGTGIPWTNNPQNDPLAAALTEQGWKTIVGAVTMPLCLVKDARTGEAYATIYYNLGERGVGQQRYVPLPIVNDRAVKSAIALQNAAISPNVAEFTMLDPRKEGEKPVAAFCITITRAQIDELRTARDQGTEAFKEYLRSHDKLPQWIDLRWPQGGVHAFQVVYNNEDGTHCVKVVTDGLFHVASQETGLMNPKDPRDPSKSARGVEDLFMYTLSFDFEGRYHGEGGMLKLHENIHEEHRTLTPRKQQSLLQGAPSDLTGIRQQHQIVQAIDPAIVEQQQQGGR